MTAGLAKDRRSQQVERLVLQLLRVDEEQAGQGKAGLFTPQLAYLVRQVGSLSVPTRMVQQVLTGMRRQGLVFGHRRRTGDRRGARRYVLSGAGRAQARDLPALTGVAPGADETPVVACGGTS